jgi:hypothetical protein
MLYEFEARETATLHAAQFMKERRNVDYEEQGMEMKLIIEIRQEKFRKSCLLLYTFRETRCKGELFLTMLPAGQHENEN